MSLPGALVWGPFGFIGRHLTAALLDRGWRVSILSRSSRLYDDPGWGARVRHFELEDGCDNAAVLRLAVSTASVVYDLAGSSGAVASNRAPKESLESNCLRHLEFLDACAAAGHKPHIVYASSRLVYGETGREPVAEDHPLSPQSMYAAHRISVENYLGIYSRLGHVTFTICRISNTYGYDPGRNRPSYGVLNAFIRQAVAGRAITLFGEGRQLRDYVYIADLVEALVRCGTCPAARNQLFNIGLGASTTLRAAAVMIQELAGAPPLQFVPWPEDWKSVESGDYVADTRKATSLLGLSCSYDLAAGLKETIGLYRRDPGGNA
jgi:UDP-glucose 4-epimerase